ncbi:MAG: DNA-binding response regulator [Puniceicoccaceae bacterium]|nr:MAG: DNA-binding response regulator [Puniceicoccaceae bacterium]
MEIRLKTIVVEDQRLGIDLVLQCLDERFEVCATARTAKEAWSAFQKYHPEVVILDIELPDGNGLDLANRMLRARKDVKILGVSGRTAEFTLYQVFKTGFFGFVDKNSESIDDLRNAIDHLANGNCYYAAAIQQNMLLQRSNPQAFSNILSEREQELMCHFGVGSSNEIIAEKLNLRPVSVQNHRARIMRKLGLHSTVDLIRYALDKGFANPSEFRESSH